MRASHRFTGARKTGWKHTSMPHKAQMHSHCEPANTRDPVHPKSPFQVQMQLDLRLLGWGQLQVAPGAQGASSVSCSQPGTALLLSCHKLQVPRGSPGTTDLITKINSPGLLLVVHQVNMAAVRVNNAKQEGKEGEGAVFPNLSFTFLLSGFSSQAQCWQNKINK